MSRKTSEGKKMKYTLVFIHGLESTSQGTKAQYFRKLFPEMIIEDYTGDFETRMRKLKRVLNGKDDLILVGSSFGGLMAARFALDDEPRVKKLILLAPALILEGFENAVNQKLQLPVIIYHGTRDNVVNPYAVKKIAEKTFGNLEHHLVDDDHPLNSVFPQLDWPKLLFSIKLKN
jgi:alpha-beta hydrolase superfamily lysophospholipase